MQKKKCKLLSKYIYVCVFCLQTRMNVGVAHSEVNPNTRVMNSRGIWLTYALGVGILHIVLLSIPFFSVPVVWTLTNVIHNFVSYISHLSPLLLLLLTTTRPNLQTRPSDYYQIIVTSASKYTFIS